MLHTIERTIAATAAGVQAAPAAECDALRMPVSVTKVGRRRFLQGVGAGTGLVLAVQFALPRPARAFEPYPTGAEGMPHKTVNDPKVFVAIAPDGTVTLVTHRSEMGTGARTSVPMVLADELDADWSRVRLVQAPGDEPRFGNQDTDGSRSLRHYIQPMRQCGAAMRTMLETAAAAAWGVDVARVRARLHAVHLLDGTGPDGRETGRRLGYGELARAAMALPVPPADKLRYKTDAQFRYMGKGETPIYDLYDITVGRAQYGADVRLEGMKYAVVARPPVVGGKLRKVDSSDALKVPGVERVVEIPGSMPPAKFAPLGGVAVVARSTWAAIQGREKLRIEWDDGPHGSYDTAAFKAEMLKTAASPARCCAPPASRIAPSPTRPA